MTISSSEWAYNVFFNCRQTMHTQLQLTHASTDSTHCIRSIIRGKWHVVDGKEKFWHILHFFWFAGEEINWIAQAKTCTLKVTMCTITPPHISGKFNMYCFKQSNTVNCGNFLRVPICCYYVRKTAAVKQTLGTLTSRFAF